MARKLSRRMIARHVAERIVAGDAHDVITQQLAAYLIESRRTNEAATILRDVAYHLAEAGHVEAVVTSTYALDASVEAAIEALVKRATDATDVTITATLDPSVLGGVKIETPGHELNATVAHKLQVLKTRYKKA